MFRILISLLLLSSGLTFAQSDLSVLATENMELGLKANENLLNFIITHPCEVGAKINCDRPLSSRDISLLKDHFRKLDNWRRDVFEKIIPATDRLKGLPYKLEKGPAFSYKEVIRFNPLTLKKETTLRLIITADQESRQFFRDVQITTASTLLMYDSFFKLSQALAGAKKIRTILENDLRTEGHILHETFAVAMDEKVWKSTQNNMIFLKEVAPTLTNINYFDQYITKSFTGSKITDRNASYRIQNVLFMERIFSQVSFFNALDRVVGRLSQMFGNTAGQVQERDGKMKILASSPVAMNKMKAKLKPLDILFEKTPFRLTDRFIPGFFGHVAIWLGRPEEIMSYRVTFQGKEIALLDHPDMSRYLEQMSLGKLIVEALREPGVTMNTLEHFMDIDDFLVLRSTTLEADGEKLLKTIQQVGKPYDFNFDVETEDSLVCSELIYTVFNDQDWPTSRSMGRFTISPDHVAWKTFDGCLEPQILFRDGKEVTQDMSRVLEAALSAEGGISYTPTGRCNYYEHQ